MSATLLIGIDCATDPKNVGLAAGHLDGKERKLEITRAESHETWDDIEKTVVGWLGSAEKCLLAIDAPLGWPRHLGNALVSHEAGCACAFQNLKDDSPFQRTKKRKTSDADLLFQRATDRRIHDALDIKPLDVGANLIARTAHSALCFLDGLRRKTGLPIPLAPASVAESVKNVLAIEVYPAATLKAFGFPYKGYKDEKKEAHMETRACIIRRLDNKMKLRKNIKNKMQDNSDILDAVVCVLAAADFVDERVHLILPESTEDQKLAEKEGWIWVRKP